MNQIWLSITQESLYFDLETLSEDFPLIELPDDWRDLNVYSKRKLVIALVTNNGRFSPWLCFLYKCAKHVQAFYLYNRFHQANFC